ncbi:serine/threonine-protein kinase [Synoicihabitans lomoniglobus]|uniref:Serine/threonine-protein kinase n=1 Tax=Synoicihabitans lomoniglobus TaxID=2909285 RepID=A0AAF0CR59_9BACT|nr:serine/threonine protein kinase [Opitutaceae bacterium LMO-M01]WED66536.1 serine/threonine-protein kinase [Opitutaceae bacterium LMO-M01]
MTRDDEIFALALDAPPSQRSALLDRIGQEDTARRERIESLLAAFDQAGDFLEDPVMDPLTPFPEEKPGDTIDRYTLIKQIGEGGCGTVHLAEQREPVRRKVALKVIKLGMDTHAVITRFEGERQALAMMDHPDIARVFDAGATETGRPYFVMEYVDGEPITKFCDRHQLSIAQRLELFARVCLALQHAHQKGIIHRDIKPSNILVARHDGVPSPKVIDFGIAKATQERLTDQTLVTHVGHFIGTPAYMSPEQADQRDIDIDTRSDVYALGVLLYELLGGGLPFNPKALAQSGVDEIRRTIREIEPSRPSQRFSKLTEDDRVSIARQRGIAPPQLSSVLQGDLDWIVMRCLEKDRDRRYGTAQELADDVRRHLRHEPVEARPPSTAYRVERFVARHRLACASALVVALTLILGTIVSVRQAVRATRAERVANVERDAANIARTDAQRRQEQAEDLLTFMLGDFRTELQKIGRLQLLDTVGEKAMTYFAELPPRDLTDTALARQAKALTQIGEVRLDEAKYDEASHAFTTAYDRAATLAARHPGDGDILFERAQAEYWIGFVARRRADFPAAREWLLRYRDSAFELVSIEGNTPRALLEVVYGLRNLAVLDRDNGDLESAREGFRAERTALDSMLATTPDDLQLRHRLVANAGDLGLTAEWNGDYPAALEHFFEMSAHVEKLLAQEPEVAVWQVKLAECSMFIGRIQVLMGQPIAASRAFDHAKQIIDRLAAQDPSNRHWQEDIQYIQLEQVTRLLAVGDGETARPILVATLAQLDALVKEEPSSSTLTAGLATAWRLESRLRGMGRSSGADEAIARAIEWGEPLIEAGRANNRTKGEFARSLILAGRIASARGQIREAHTQWIRALDVLKPQLSGSNDWRLLDPAAQALVLLGRTEEARPFTDRLQRFGYHALDPSAAATLNAASSSVRSPSTH